VEPIDEVAITNLQSYRDKKFVDISKEDLELGKSRSLFSSELKSHVL
jgi:heat shock protein beta